MRKWFLLVVFGCFSLPLISQNLTPNTTGSFTFVPSGELSSKSIKVFYHIPNGDLKTMPILMSFHGVERNADEYRDYWISMANTNKFMVFAPEFSDAQFSTGDAYNLANIFDDGDSPSTATFNSKDEWTFSVLDPLFTLIKTAVSGTQQKYNAWGHSAGAQFLHRFVMYVPNSNLDIAVCSNAGWYTVPEFSEDFPYGLNKGQLPTNDLKAAFSKKLIVHLGLNDTDPNSAGLRHNTIVDNQQGMHRLARGRYFFTESQTTSKSLNTPFNWEKDEVPSVSHNAQLMANDALEHILKSTLSINQVNHDTQLFAYPNPVKNELFFDNSALNFSKIHLYSINGKFIKTYVLNKATPKQKINTSALSSGIYFLKQNNFIQKIIKE